MKFIDLTRQYPQIKEEAEKRVLNVMRSTNYIMGQEVREFEANCAEYLGVKYAIGVANGTDALVLALAALGIKEGDEVITTPFTFFATAESIERVGAVPVFVDIDAETLNIDVTKIEEKITDKTKAILPVHIFGNACDMDAINDIAKKHDLYVIEDACQAFGGEYKGKKLGAVSDVSCVSFFPTKNLGGMGDGGLIATNSDNIATIVKALKNHGSGLEGRTALGLLNLEFEDNFEIREGFEKYYNYLIGYNSRLDEMQAAVLNAKIPFIDEWNAGRRKVAEVYNTALADKYAVQKSLDDVMPVYHMYSLQHKSREQIIDKLTENGIPSGVYYPIPMHLQKAFAHLGYKKGDLPVVEKICDEIFAVPVFPELTAEEQEKIINILKEF
ncbi:DegT/DnrJ/EryC1/StrS family aminotransferase [Faecalicatena contorta]|uniref:DegT/DnrJ/EryC1/StrS family aminotransferase n=1 Tax=Faecalicatena contorta TaxID=39482 RepID=UPI001F4654DD|nr:DegT/DnrJ/EryC1/StrS family aminotransferase [Faecalicatena contorta]MCF2680716.1 DegT/DnrJ/EryC1/StrS family aminotransferase [Faecalicatena contorta]